MANRYPITANCNYESGDERDRSIHAAHKAIEAGWVDDTSLRGAMDSLEETLAEYAERSDMVAVEACRRAEDEVLEAWTGDLQETARSRREAGYRD